MGKNPCSTIYEANIDIWAMYGRKGGLKISCHLRIWIVQAKKVYYSLLYSRPRRSSDHTGPHHPSTCSPTDSKCTPGTSRWPLLRPDFTQQPMWKSQGASLWGQLITFTSRSPETRRPISTTLRATGQGLGQDNSCLFSFAHLLGIFIIKSSSFIGLAITLMFKGQVKWP